MNAVGRKNHLKDNPTPAILYLEGIPGVVFVPYNVLS